MMRLFEFQDTTLIGALVLAADQDDATELFEEHVLAEGGDPDSLLWRELALEHLTDDALPCVRDAMGLNREGLVICQDEDRWLFVTRVGNHGSAEQR